MGEAGRCVANVRRSSKLSLGVQFLTVSTEDLGVSLEAEAEVMTN